MNLHFKKKERIFEILGMALFCLAAIKFSFFAIQFKDLHLQDESDFYIFPAIYHSITGFQSASLGPLYSIWYLFLRLFVKSNIDLFYLNQGLLMAAMPIAFFGLLKVYKVKTPIALVAGFIILISYFNLEVLKHAHFITIIACLSLICFKIIKDKLSGTAALATGGLLISLCRPEYIISYVLFSLVTIVLLIKNLKFHKFHWHQGVSLGILIILSTALFAKFGVPVLDNERSRGLWAFDQHFTRNYLDFNDLQQSPVADTHIFDEIFHEPNSVGEALRNNPKAFFQQIGYNLRMFPVYFPRGLFYHLNIILKNDFHILNRIEGVILFLAFIAGSVFLFFIQWKRGLKIKSWIKRHKYLLAALLVLFLPAFLSILVIFPRTHYLVLPAVLLLFTMALFVSEHTKRQFSGRSTVLIAAVIFLITPPFASLFRDSDLEEFKPNLNTVYFLDSIMVKPTKVSVRDMPYHLYTENKNVQFTGLKYQPGFVEKAPADTALEAMVADESLFATYELTKNNNTARFFKRMEEEGFVAIPIPNTERWFFIRQEKLSHLNMDILTEMKTTP